jgi:hypothetical protein
MAAVGLGVVGSILLLVGLAGILWRRRRDSLQT